MRYETKIQFSACDRSGQPDERLRYMAPECRALVFSTADPLCESGDLITDGQGEYFDTNNGDEGTGENYYGNGGN